jgi:hypothetical protein
VCSPSGLVSFLISGLDFSGFEHPRSFLQLIFFLQSVLVFLCAASFHHCYSVLRRSFDLAAGAGLGRVCPPKIPRQSSCSRFSFFVADFCCLHFFAWVQCIASSAEGVPARFCFRPGLFFCRFLREVLCRSEFPLLLLCTQEHSSNVVASEQGGTECQSS